MNFQDCLEYAKQAGGCTLATIDGDQPRVRALDLGKQSQGKGNPQDKVLKACLKPECSEKITEM